MGVRGEVGRAVFLDRDGIVNKSVVRNGKPYPPASISELQLVDGIVELIDFLRSRGFKIFIFTNQPDVARGATTLEKVEEIHDFLSKKLGIDQVYVCVHDDKDNCQCRKPKPGMILQAQNEWNVDLGSSFAIGDRWRDIAAAKAAGVRSIFVDYQYDEEKVAADYQCNDIKEVHLLLQKLEKNQS
jgi:D-glycero-D-manno-heptose 1,7-bisphosphate phosphatase